MLDDKGFFRVTDIKEFVYCQRVFFYENCLPDLNPTTYKMTAGVQAHEKESARAARRTLKAYGLADGERRFNVSVESSELGLRGEIDEVVITSDAIYVVDYKLARKAGKNFKVQLAAYALLLEHTWQERVKGGFLYLIPARSVEKVRITKRERNQVQEIVRTMHHIVNTEQMPPPVAYRKRCLACKHRRFCNDV
jgi:CRISPR-associated exonuclease Cas4